MVGRALDGEIERDLQAVLTRRRDERTEVLDRAKPMAYTLPTSSAVGVSVLFLPLRFFRPIGLIGGKYSTSKPSSLT